MTSPGEQPMDALWVGSAEAVRRLQRRNDDPDVAKKALVQRAASGFLRSRMLSRTRTRGDERERSQPRYEEVPERLWKHALRHDLSKWDWQSGDLRLTEHPEYGVEISHFLIDIQFAAADLAEMMPDVAASSVFSSPRSGRGRPQSGAWVVFAEELAVYVHKEGLPDGDGSAGQGTMIETLSQALSDRGVELSRTSMQPVVSAVLHRIRSAIN